MSSYTCPKGHQSSESDFCDTCGAKISPLSSPPSPVPSPEAPTVPFLSHTSSSEPPCPHCGAPRGGSARFCEDCGYDHTTGRVPQLDATVAAPPRGDWTATVFADRVYFDANEADGVTFPADAPELSVTLPAPQVRIGRHSTSKGTAPDLDLTDDPGVSHNHALLTLSIDGEWLVSDLGSTNGTYINDEDAPLTAGQSRTLKDGDQVHVGIWTTITLHAPA